ncbi:MAG: hypothetical protein HYR71_02075 [Chloroflexi bacterium]|nr:hypothetical protein [Chloroflexota bacterium]
MPPTHPYAAELAKKLERKSDHRLTIRFRTLLNGFGYYRRTEAAAAEIFKHLQACGLT